MGINDILQFIILTTLVFGKGKTFIGPSPDKEAVLIGSNHTLICRRESSTGTIGWDEALSVRRRATLFYNETREDRNSKYDNFRLDNANLYDLIITDIQIEDEGIYVCRHLKLSRELYATRTVEVPVVSCKISTHGADATVVTLTEGQLIEITCTVTRSRPAVDIWWYHRTQHGSEIRIISGVSQSNTSNGDGTFDTVSNLQYNASKEYNKGQLRCVTTGQEVAASKEDVVTLNIQYHPNVLVKYDDSTIFCTSDANPEVNQYVIVVSTTDHEYGIIPTCRGNNCIFPHEVEIGTRIWCNATNKIGSGNAEADIAAFEVVTTNPISAILSPTTWSADIKASCRVSGWTVTGIIVAIMVLIGVIVLVLICIFVMKIKGHKKSDSTDTGTDGPNAPQSYMELDSTSREQEGAYAEPQTYMKLDSKTREKEDVYEQPKIPKGLETEGQETEPRTRHTRCTTYATKTKARHIHIVELRNSGERGSISRTIPRTRCETIDKVRRAHYYR
ncbi:cell adhesion molecule 2-like isoform X2 [Amphiura filiformis]|uniref:cell adhesion molecule 2-like isoform X2 n=1 Tax=Amphiura filiformis TaxID=82378 RepID=UPI003B20F312